MRSITVGFPAFFMFLFGADQARSAAADNGSCAWYPSITPRSRGVVVVTHGLNNKPEIMDRLIDVLNSHELDAQRVSLAEYEQSNGVGLRSLEDRWHDNISSAIADSLERRPGLPVYALGYSLGGLVTVSYADRRPDAFKRMVLLAPAIAFTKSSRVLRTLSAAAGGTNIALPSFSPPALRARDATPLAEYAAMFRLADSVRNLKNPCKLDGIPTRIWISPKDELVSDKELAKWLTTNSLSGWDLVPLGVDNAASYQHLIVLPDAFREDRWQQLTTELARFFSP